MTTIACTWKKSMFHSAFRVERSFDDTVERFILRHKVLGFLLVFVGAPAATLAAVFGCTMLVVFPLALALGLV